MYQVAIRFVAIANDVVQALPRGRGYLGDPLQRAATSIPLNIDVCRQLALIAPDRFGAGRDLLLRIVSMLVKLGRSVARDGDADAAGGSVDRPWPDLLS